MINDGPDVVEHVPAIPAPWKGCHSRQKKWRRRHSAHGAIAWRYDENNTP
jgi:hypothetical protein